MIREGDRLGGLCSGVGGLELAVEAVTGASLAWMSEIDPAASAVLAERFDVPNLGDFRSAQPEPVDVLCAGFPCQPVSQAGQRAGVDDERWLFDDICTFVGRMDPPPRMLVFENVAGLLTANGGDAMARVVHGLARLGYLGRWRAVRASAVGACHRRERVFITAYADEPGSQGAESARRRLMPAGRSRAIATNRDRGRRAIVGQRDQPSAGWLTASSQRHDADRLDSFAAADTCGERRLTRPGICADGPEGLGRRRPADDDRAALFGPYAQAVERWERVLNRPAPDPTDDGKLSARFVEWMMGFDEGWVTDLLPRRHALRCLGNAVVQQQAAHALVVLA